MPENYSSELSFNYKFKAIPYSAVDNPVMGSEFSDSILTYILTFFCYKIVNSKYRKIDKDYIINYFENLCKVDIKNIEILFSFLKDCPKSYKHYIDNVSHYRNNYKDTFELNDFYFTIIIKQILDININYYSKCRNISFNDLLLYKNVKNFVCFTGTAYIKPPISHKEDINFNEHNYITFSKINSYQSVTDAIYNIICNEEIVCDFFTNKNEILIEDIFSCLNQYEVLIDIGGIFIKYNINSFIEEYKKFNGEKIKEHIVYFDNGRKIYNIRTNKFVNDDSINHINAFYYFSNKNITGVDAKNIMNPKAHGLVTITNNTNLRDFSQGIFRMRHILEGQTIDIIFNEKFKDIIMTGGYDNFKKIEESNIRENIIKNLILQQEIIDKQKEKVLIKQNIFALNKETLNADINQQILYLDPMTVLYNSSIIEFNDYITEYKPVINKFDIDSLNIIKKNIKPIRDNLINNLVTKYFTYEIDVLGTKQNVVEEQVEQKVEQKVVNQILSIPYNGSINNQGIIYYNFKYNHIDKNQILVTYKFGENNSMLDYINNFDIILIYDNTNNNLIIIELKVIKISCI
jgi:hypothetical protein